VSHDYSDDIAYATNCTSLLAREGFRVTKTNAALYMFCDIKLWSSWCDIFRAVGWYVWPVPLIWNKGNVGSLLGAANGPRHCYEAVLYATKGSRACKTLSDVISVPSPRAELHAAEKPVELYLDLLSRLAVPGDAILDPFCGSGPVFPAARALHCTATGIELNDAHIATATLRLFGAQA
jgi:DNA modification methylase